MADSEKLQYQVHKYSSYATSYLPENILEDTPTNQASRWSSNTNNPPQFLTLKLQRPAIVEKIKFGKFEKSHVCNLKKFRVYGGLDEERMVLLLEGGLKNDSVAEVFSLRCLTEDGEKLPVLYIKIMPLLSWGSSFNFSIWYIELHGQDDPMFMGLCLRNYNTLREIEIIKLCLKHFRQQGYSSAFKTLQEETNVQLEHNLLTKLHECLVINGDFERAENLISEYVSNGIMDPYLATQAYKYSWKIQPIMSEIRPGNRGGHQLVMDSNKSLIYLFGGWDGYRDLSDLWVFDIEKSAWSLIFERCENVGGPTPRSCHKMVFDPISENIFMLGRYLDNQIRTADYIKSDFFLYDTRACTWLQICDDTSQVGGPQLVYDHQMCIDTQKRIIYVFGGKILTPRSVNNTPSNEPEYSGLFSYHIGTNTWSHILVDCQHPSVSSSDVLSVKSRITHCMVFHNKTRKLYIYGGQRGKEDIDEFLSYDVDTQDLSVLNKDSSGYDTKKEPSPGFTLRATIDCDKDEIYIFSSLSKQKDRRDIPQVESSNSFWAYSLTNKEWAHVYTAQYPIDDIQTDKVSTSDEPCPRYAHQFIYDECSKVHYLFGGNPGKSSSPQLRLDDFWVLQLQKPTREEILKHYRYLLRKLHYEEITRVDPIRALRYLQTSVSDVIDHSNRVQLNQFHKLAGLLFRPEENNFIEQPSLATMPVGNQEQTAKKDFRDADDSSMEFADNSLTHSDNASYLLYRNNGGKRSRREYLFEIRSHRSFLFNKISELMPANMVQPKNNLSDFVVT